MKYWIRINGRDLGPLTEAEIVSQHGASLHASTPCARVGENQWGSIASILPNLVTNGAAESPSPEVATKTTNERSGDFATVVILSFGIRIGTALIGLIFFHFSQKYHSRLCEFIALLFALICFLGSRLIAKELVAISAEGSKAPFVSVIFYRYLPLLYFLPVIGPILDRVRVSKSKNANPFLEKQD